MASLALFTETSITEQTVNQSYGVASASEFHVSSMFSVIADPVTEETKKAFSIVKGTILLQQQTNNPNKVNLILRPHDQNDLKLPVKYIIYRGINTQDFIDNTDLTDLNNKVKTSGTELLEEIQLIQQSRSSDEIPLEALFGNDLNPIGTKNIDEFFFKNLAPTSQLYTIDCGIELGKFAVGEIGIEIVLENPEFFVNVALAKAENHTITIGSEPAAEKKWKKDLVRHFVDPAAFYGLHCDIKGGIEYRDSSNVKQPADTKELVYDKILNPFKDTTRNTVYLDIRNENGYSYNYYDNYLGNTGVDDDKEFKIGQTSGSINPKEYYTDGWAVHKVDVITPGSTEENEFFLALRVNDNERPLLASWNVELTPNTLTDPPLENPSTKRVCFVDEFILLGEPSPSSLPEFTNAISVKVPNVASKSAQLGTIVRLEYIKQIQIDDPDEGVLPYRERTDYLFGPISTKIPWDSEDGMQWIDSYHKKYVDGFNQGFISGKEEFDIESIDPALKKITIDQVIDQQISSKIHIRNVSTHWQNVGDYNVIKVEVVGTKTEITVLDNIQTKYSGDRIVIEIEAAIAIEKGSTNLIARDIDLTSIPAFQIGKRIKLYTVFSSNAKASRKITNITLNGTSTHLTINSPITDLGFGAIMQSGMVSETDLTPSPSPSDNDNIIFYAVPQRYFKKYGMTNTILFNYKGGTNNSDSFIEMIQKQTKKFDIEKFSLQPTIGNFLATLSYKDDTKAKEIILLLGLKKSEFEDLKTIAETELSPYHLQMLKLIPQGNRLRDVDYEPYYKYHLVVTGKDSIGNYKETSVYKEIYSRDGLIFTSPEYARTGSSQSAIGLDEALDELLDINNQSLSKLYNKTNEEIKQLSTLWNNISGAKSNKELYLLDGYTLSGGQYTLTGDLNTLPLELRNELDTLYSNYPNSSVPVNEIENLLLQKGAELITLARQRIRVVSQPYTNKDGILYLVRLIMQLVLKNHKAVINSANGYQYFSNKFEAASRGWEGTAKPSFSGYPSSYKKVLISGFDPFGAGFDWEGYNSNPSGNIALALDGELLKDAGDNIVGVIRSAIFPVRWKDFDDKCAEDFFEQYFKFGNNRPDIIITYSYGIHYSNAIDHHYHLERFAANYRSGGQDNNNPLHNTPYVAQKIMDLIPSEKKHTYIETTLPLELLANSNDEIEVPNYVAVINHGGESESIFGSGNSPYQGKTGYFHWVIYGKPVSNPSAPEDDITSLFGLNKPTNLFPNPFQIYGTPSNIVRHLPLFIRQNSECILVCDSKEVKYYHPSGTSDYIPLPEWNAYKDSDLEISYNNIRIEARSGSGGAYMSNEIFYRVAYLRETYKKQNINIPTGHIHMGFNKVDPNGTDSDNREKMLNDIIYMVRKFLYL